MPLRKVIGTETEYGITVRNQADFNPVLGSSLVINSYAGGRARIQWSFEEETPGRDARGFGYDSGGPSDIDGGLVNVVLTNGARLYVDHAHPEYSTPECSTPRDCALYDKAGEFVMTMAARSSQAVLPPEEQMLIHKNNSDGKGNSYGAHENYLVSRDLPFSEIVRHMTTFFVTRQIFTGSGKVGSENGRPDADFQLTQRADFFEEEVGLETTLKRPIINTRDEPHGDASKYRRLHVIIGDATMSEIQTYVKLGSAALMLSALEDGALLETLALADPVTSCWQVSHDVGMTRPLRLADGGTATALELQWQYYEWLAKYVESGELDPDYDSVLAEWEAILTDLETDPARTADRLDWAAKLQILQQYRDRDGMEWGDPKARMVDLQYHDVDPERSLYYKLIRAGRMRRLFADSEIEAAVAAPPETTRAYFRGECVRRYGASLVAANWDSLVFDVGEDTLKRVPMMEPLRGTRERVGSLLDRCQDAAELMRALGGPHG